MELPGERVRMVVSFKFDRYDGRMGSMKEYLSIMRRYKSTRLFHDCTWVASSCSVLFFLSAKVSRMLSFSKGSRPYFRMGYIRYKHSLYEVSYILYLPDVYPLPCCAVYLILCVHLHPSNTIFYIFIFLG